MTERRLYQPAFFNSKKATRPILIETAYILVAIIEEYLKILASRGFRCSSRRNKIFVRALLIVR